MWARLVVASVLLLACSDDTAGGGGPGGNGHGGAGDGGGNRGDGGPCMGLQCQQTSCPAGQTTSLSGVVNIPAGNLPLPNVIVYVPNAPVAPIRSGASCD